MKKENILQIAKLLAFITFVHLYILLCSLAYTKLEGIQTHLNETVDDFLLKVHNGDLSSQDATQILRKYKVVHKEEKEWSEQNSFNNIPKTFVFVLAAHTTLGNRHMNVQSRNAKVFYMFTVPLGVILYYVMIHLLSVRFLSMIRDASMLVWRKEDKNLNDRQRDIFVRIKVALSMCFYVIFLMLCFSLTCLFENHSFITELLYMFDILLTISSSENFVLYKLSHDDLNAFITTIIYFVCILFAYSTSYTISSLFMTFSAKEVFGFICGNSNDDYIGLPNDEKRKSIWDEYDPNVDNTKSKPTELPLSSVANETTDWLHNDGLNEDQKPMSIKTVLKTPYDDFGDDSDIFHTVEDIMGKK